ncbi:MAG: thioesterase [Pseudonocardiales bacterium]|nr:MAG: thioesterase [Pseudonocardiales bacterium]
MRVNGSAGDQAGRKTGTAIDLVAFDERPDAEVVLVCVPYAGGGASIYRELARRIPPHVEVLAARLPGRESRFCEEPVVSPDQLADAIEGAVQRPYAFYGHSMGARLAFETTRRLDERGGRLPQRLFIGGCKPPHLTSRGPLEGISRLPEAELIDSLTAAGGMPAEVLATPELLELVMPALRADLAWCDNYRYRPGRPVAMPIRAFAGHDDPTVTPDDMQAWEQHTASRFDLHVLPGDHFFVNDSVAELCLFVADDLAAPAPANSGGSTR